jgi:hypothetical protein
MALSRGLGQDLTQDKVGLTGHSIRSNSAGARSNVPLGGCFRQACILLGFGRFGTLSLQDKVLLLCRIDIGMAANTHERG